MSALSDPTPGVSVVVPTKERHEALRRCLDAVLRAAERVAEPVELIVLDDAEEEAVQQVMRNTTPPANASLRYVPRGAYGGNGPIRGREHGVRCARHDLVAFTDDDTACDPDWLRQAVGRLRSAPELAGLEGAVVADVRPPLDAVRARVVQSRGGGAFLTANLILRRDAVLRAGGFQRLWEEPLLSPRLHFREDTDLGLRVRDRVGPVPFEPALVVRHPVDQPALLAHLHTALFFILDAPFARLHPGALPGLRAAPLARFRIRAASVTLAALPLLGPRRTRSAAVLAMAACTAGVSLHVERELRAAGLRRGRMDEARTAILRLPRSFLWCLLAGLARVVGMVLVRSPRMGVRRERFPPAAGVPRPTVTADV